MRRRLATGMLLLASCGLSLLGAELASHWLKPVEIGVAHVASDGSRIGSWLAPGRVYRQVSAEFDALTSITDEGYRGPAARGDPEVVFLGDSFTFGWGLSDDETFASVYCRSLRLRCANLGAPGTGTLEQVEILERFLSGRGWRPAEVKLFIFAMTASFSAGNDLADNYEYAQRRQRGAEEGAPSAAERRGLLERVLGLRRSVLRHSNLVRLAKYYWGPALRSALVPQLDRERLEASLAITRRALQHLHRLSAEYGFAYSIYVIHPVQDILRASDEATRAELEHIAPAPVRRTAQLFAADPPHFYYAYDGHLNRAGSQRIAEFLVAERGSRS